jgi:hypothetical protein
MVQLWKNHVRWKNEKRKSVPSFLGVALSTRGKVTSPLVERMGNDKKEMKPGQAAIARVLWGLLANAVVPVLLYKLVRGYYAGSEYSALVVAAGFPLAKSTLEWLFYRRSDPISIVVLLGIMVNVVVIFSGGGPRILLVRESLFTGAFGLACFLSLLLPRPMMFHFARYFIAGANQGLQARLDAGWQFAELRFCHRLITIVWGCMFIAEFVIRIILIYLAPTAVVLVITPVLMGLLIVITLVWSLRYAYKVRDRVLARVAPSVIYPAQGCPISREPLQSHFTPGSGKQ